MGKNDLIKHVYHLLTTQKKINCIYLDIYASPNLKDLTNQLANSIYNLFPEKKGIGKKFWETIKLFRPILSIDPLSGNPELSLDISQPKQFEKTIPHLLQFLDNQRTKTVITIDEFQQILNYPEKNVEAILRTSMQTLKHTSFIFCGSNQSMMHQLFNTVARPFYASCKSINLQAIDSETYKIFIQNTFQTYKFKIADQELTDILDYTHGHTYYTQSMCHEIFMFNQKNIQPTTLQIVKHKILQEREAVFFQYRNLLTTTQWQLLHALAKEDKVFQPYTKSFITRYKLGSSAIVKRSLEALLQKEMIYRNTSVEQPYFAVYDKFLLRWLQHTKL